MGNLNATWSSRVRTAMFCLALLLILGLRRPPLRSREAIRLSSFPRLQEDGSQPNPQQASSGICSRRQFGRRARPWPASRSLRSTAFERVKSRLDRRSLPSPGALQMRCRSDRLFRPAGQCKRALSSRSATIPTIIFSCAAPSPVRGSCLLLVGHYAECSGDHRQLHFGNGRQSVSTPR